VQQRKIATDPSSSCGNLECTGLKLPPTACESSGFGRTYFRPEVSEPIASALFCSTSHRAAVRPIPAESCSPILAWSLPSQ